MQELHWSFRSASGPKGSTTALVYQRQSTLSKTSLGGSSGSSSRGVMMHVARMKGSLFAASPCEFATSHLVTYGSGCFCPGEKASFVIETMRCLRSFDGESFGRSRCSWKVGVYEIDDGPDGDLGISET